MQWYKKTIKKYYKKISNGTILAFLFFLVYSVWKYFSGKSFVWLGIEPVEQPKLFVRIFYSALVFVILGALLYELKFYRFLYRFIVVKLRDIKLYKDTKYIIWTSLILLMYYKIIPLVVDMLNKIISIFYNLVNLLLYLMPSAGITVVIFASYILVKQYKFNQIGVKN